MFIMVAQSLDFTEMGHPPSAASLSRCILSHLLASPFFALLPQAEPEKMRCTVFATC